VVAKEISKTVPCALKSPLPSVTLSGSMSDRVRRIRERFRERGIRRNPPWATGSAFVISAAPA